MTPLTRDAQLNPNKKLKPNPKEEKEDQEEVICKCSICHRARISIRRPLTTTQSPDQCRCTICARQKTHPPPSNYGRMCQRRPGCHCRTCEGQRTRIRISNLIKRVPLEVWGNVWEYLEPFQLNKVTQACKFFHTSASPKLYRRIIISDPSQLFYGLDHIPTSGRTSKLEMLNSIRYLHFAYDFIKVQPDNQWADQHLSIRHHEYIPNLSQKLRCFSHSIKQLEIFNKKEARNHDAAPTPGLFNRLKTVSFGYREKLYFPEFKYFHDYLKYIQEFNKIDCHMLSHLLKKLKTVSVDWMKMIEGSMKPLHICREVAYGPLRFGFSTRYTSEGYTPASGHLPETSTIHFSSRHLKSGLKPYLLSGTSNRLILEDISLEEFWDTYSDEDEDQEEEEDDQDDRHLALKVFNWICDLVLPLLTPQNFSLRRTSVSTSITIYSTIDWQVVYRALCLTVANRDEDQRSIDIRDTTIESLKEVNGGPVLRLTSPSLTENHVTLELMKMEDAGVCPACGAKGEFGRCPSL